jgi:hypothetical protein
MADSIPVTDAEREAYTVPPAAGFVPTRLGLRRVVIDVSPETSAIRANLTLRPATETAWGPRDLPDMSSGDLVAELMGWPDSPEKVAALTALASVRGGLFTLASLWKAKREADANTPPEGGE